MSGALAPLRAPYPNCSEWLNSCAVVASSARRGVPGKAVVVLVETQAGGVRVHVVPRRVRVVVDLLGVGAVVAHEAVEHRCEGVDPHVVLAPQLGLRRRTGGRCGPSEGPDLGVPGRLEGLLVVLNGERGLDRHGVVLDVEVLGLGRVEQGGDRQHVAGRGVRVRRSAERGSHLTAGGARIHARELRPGALQDERAVEGRVALVRHGQAPVARQRVDAVEVGALEAEGAALLRNVDERGRGRLGDRPGPVEQRRGARGGGGDQAQSGDQERCRSASHAEQSSALRPRSTPRIPRAGRRRPRRASSDRRAPPGSARAGCRRPRRCRAAPRAASRRHRRRGRT